MKLDKLVGERFKEKPSDCVIDSHALMLRGGYMKGVANGIYSQYTPLNRICRKIEDILRDEMDKVGGQEVKFPVVLPASLWDESGRYESVGSELMRFTDRNNARLVLGMTHEEASVQLVREYANSYTKYPFMIYQIQTKFRDEARPRAGLIRVREFTMKDAYSFHTSQEDLEEYYAEVYEAYNRIFARAGLPEVVAVKSDSGMMGGSVSHEYMLLTPVGEDTIAYCSDCDYRANMEAAASITENKKDGDDEELKLVETPNIHTIEDICTFLGTPLEKSCKAVVYQQNSDDKFVVVFIRGDYINKMMQKQKYGKKILEMQENKKDASVFLMRFITVFPLDFVSLFLGSSKYNFGKYILFSFLGLAPRVILFTILGDKIYDYIPMKLIMTICLFAIPVAVIAIIIKAAVDKKRKKNESNENTADKAEMK